MKAFAAVALREVTERRFVLAAALAAALIPFLVPLLPGVPADQAVAARSLGALVLACSLGLGGALLVGASVVGRELAERRLSFHFSRPLSGPVVWGGKLAGGLALVFLAELLVYLPSSAASGHFPGLWGAAADTRAVWAVLLLPVPLFLLGWVGSVALRSRSPWLVADLVLLVTVPALLFLIVRRLLRYGHVPEPSWVVVALAVLLASLLLATLAQVAVGRTDARRGHGAQSLVLWGALLAGTAAGAVWAERTIDPGIDRLVRAWAEPAGPGGDWVLVRGSAREDGSGSTSYLLDLATGRSRLLPEGYSTLVSADGSRAVHVSDLPFSKKEIVLEAFDLKAGGSVTLDLSAWPDAVALTADGRRLAVVAGGLCTVLQLPSLRALASARVPVPRWAYEPRFVSPDVVRLLPRRSWRHGPDASTSAPRSLPDPPVAELHVAAKTLTTLATLPVSSIPVLPRTVPGTDPGPIFSLLPSPDLSRVLATGFGSARSVRLLDATTGRVLASFDGSEGTPHPVGYFLADGRVVVYDPLAGGGRLVVLSPDGARLSEVALPAGTSRVRIGLEPAKGLLALGIERGEASETWEGSLADLASGTLRPLGVRIFPRAVWSDTVSVPPPGSPATRLALADGTSRLVLFDPATGATTPLTRGRPAAK